jgi:hypothetical protein
MELVVAEADPVEVAFHALVADAPSPTQTVTRPPGLSSPARAQAKGGWKRTVLRRALLVATGVAGGAVVTYHFGGPSDDRLLSGRPRTASSSAPAVSDSASTPGALPEASSPEPSSAGSPDTSPANAEPGRLAIEFEHSVKSGLLRIWLDEELIVEQRLAGQASKKGLVFTVRKGSYKDVLEVPPGRHAFRVQVAWDDNEKTERIVGTFKPGATRRLLVRLGGRLRKGLSLEWE